MKSVAYLTLFLCCLFAALATPACVGIFPNTECAFDEVHSSPVFYGNINCGHCYSVEELSKSRNSEDPYAEKFFEEFEGVYTGYDFEVECDTGELHVYRAFAPTVPRCIGPMANVSSGKCKKTGESSIKAFAAPCQYSIRSGILNFPQPAAPICGNFAEAYEASCNECLEIPFDGDVPDQDYYVISCVDGATTYYSDSSCEEPVSISYIGDCEVFGGSDGYGFVHVQVMPVPTQNLTMCRKYYNTNDCSGPTEYVDDSTVCGGCYFAGIEIFDEPAYGAYTNCDTFATTLYGSYFCSPSSLLSAPVPEGICVIHDSGSVLFTRDCDDTIW